MSYEYHPMIRVTPLNGAAFVRDLRDQFADASGPTRTRVDYDFMQEDYDDINKVRRRTPFGIRCEVRLRFTIVDVEEHAALAEIVTALMGDATVELSMDGGFTYREVIMSRAPQPRPLARKTIIGAQHEIRLECVELLTEMPSMTVQGGW